MHSGTRWTAAHLMFGKERQSMASAFDRRVVGLD